MRYADPPTRPRHGPGPTAIEGTSGAWADWVERWHATSTLTPKVRSSYRSVLAKIGRWLATEHPGVTAHYAKITPNTLAKAYNDAGYFARNVSTIEVLVDRNAVTSVAAAAGEPWQYYDMGHGLSGYRHKYKAKYGSKCRPWARQPSQ